MKRFAALFTVGLLLSGCATKPVATQDVGLPPPPRPGEPAGIMGLSAADIRANFGTPAFVRKDGVAEMWRYDGSICKAFFFLYAEGSASVVRHVETIPRGSSTAADAACLQVLLRPRARTPVS